MENTDSAFCKKPDRFLIKYTVFSKSATTNENMQVQKNQKAEYEKVPRYSRQEPKKKETIGKMRWPEQAGRRSKLTATSTGRPKVNGEQVNLCGKQGTRTTVEMEKKANLVWGKFGLI